VTKLRRLRIPTRVRALWRGPWQLRFRQIFALFLLLGGMLFCMADYALEIARGGDRWRTADWLINYGGGFVRRGLFGQLLLDVNLPPAGTLWLLFALQTACYLLVIVYFLGFLKRESYSWWAIALALNPAALMFAAHGFPGAYRKEILVFVSLTLLAMALQAKFPTRQRTYALISGSLVVYALAVYSWEASAFALPMLIYLLVRIRSAVDIGRAFSLVAISAAAATAVSGLALGVVAHGSEAQVAAICAELRAYGFVNENLFTGAIRGIGWTTQDAFSKLAVRFPQYLWYVPLAALAVLPLIGSDWLRRNRYWAAAFAAGVVPLFFTGLDYGRWIHILVMGATICVMAESPAGRSPRWKAGFAVMFVVVWRLPHILESYERLSVGLNHTLYRIVSAIGRIIWT
jgi:hypothetical protein